MDRVLVIRHAMTSEIRRGRFPTVSGAWANEPGASLEDTGHRAAAELGTHLPAADRCWSSFAARTIETATALGLTRPGGRSVPDIEPTPELAGWDVGTWSGCSLTEVHDLDPQAWQAWFADPELVPHGGGGLPSVRQAVRCVLERAAALGGTTVALTDGEVVATMLLEALELPATALWRCDVAPASVTELHPTISGDWRVVAVNWRPHPFRRPGPDRLGLPSSAGP